MAGGSNLDQGDRLRDINKLVGGNPPGDENLGPQSPDDPMPKLLKQIGALVAAKSQTRFKTQEFGGIPWQARAVPNLAGALMDLEHGDTVKRRRFDERPANVDTGQLRSSITWRVVGPKSVQVGSNVEHAGDAQFGGPFSIDITATMKENLNSYLAKNPEHEGTMGFLRDLDSLEGERAPRTFVGLDKEDKRKIEILMVQAFGVGDFDVG